MGTSGISSPFGELSRSSGQVPHVLLTRSPLGLPQCCHRLDLVRLACVKHAASVRPEPGSNSPSKNSPAIPKDDGRSIELPSRLGGIDPSLAEGAGTIVRNDAEASFVGFDGALLTATASEAEPPRRSPALALSSSLLFSRSDLAQALDHIRSAAPFDSLGSFTLAEFRSRYFLAPLTLAGLRGLASSLGPFTLAGFPAESFALP